MGYGEYLPRCFFAYLYAPGSCAVLFQKTVRWELPQRAVLRVSSGSRNVR